jgi:CheY-like chemotaxis protein
MDSPRKTVLIVQPLELQGLIWQAALSSQGVAVTLEESAVDPTEVLAGLREASLKLPDLALIEIGGLDSNPYEFCRSCRAAYPEMAIVLTNSTQVEISAPEQRWAIFQGVQDLLPGFQVDTPMVEIANRVARVLEVLGWRSLQRDALMKRLSTISALQRSVASVEPAVAIDPLNALTAPLELPPKLEPLGTLVQPVDGDMAQSKPASVKAKKPKKPPDDPADGMIYRGVRVR